MNLSVACVTDGYARKAYKCLDVRAIVHPRVQCSEEPIGAQ